MVVCGMPAQTPTTITAGSAVLEVAEQVELAEAERPAQAPLTGPELGS